MIALFIRKAVRSDLKTIEKVYIDASIMMDECRLPPWKEGFPGSDWFDACLSDGTLMTITDPKDRICGAVRFSCGDGALEISDFALIHGYRGKGYSSIIFRYAERYALADGLGRLRITADSRNYVICMAAIRFGFRITDYFPGGIRVFEYSMPDSRPETGENNE